MSFKIFFINLINLFLAVLGLCCCTGFSRVAASVSCCGMWASHHGGFSSVEHGLQGTGASAVVAPGF